MIIALLINRVTKFKLNNPIKPQLSAPTIVKINAIWCSACLIMNKIWKNVLKKYDIETINLDYDIDEEEVKKYNVGDVLPVFIFYKDDIEVCRVVGEKSEDEFINIIDGIGD